MKVDILIMLKQKITRLFAKILTAIGLKEQNELYYIGGAETLPPPLSQEEETEILNRLLNNDESVRKILIERNLRLVVYIAKKFENTSAGIEDLISIGTIGLMKAINTYDVK